MTRKRRLKILAKMGQAAAAPATATTTTNPTATPTVSGSSAVVAPAPRLDVWTAYPAPCKAYSEQQIVIVNNLVQRLSGAVNQLTNGKYNFQKLRDASFAFDPSEFADAGTKYLMLFFGKVFKFLLNNGVAFPTQPINPKQLGNIIAALNNSTELAALAEVNPTGPVANQAPGNSNLFQTIRNTLQALQPTVAIPSR